MIESLQKELAESKEANEKSLSQRLYIIIGLAALSLILLILVIVLSVKLRNAEYESYDDDEDEDFFYLHDSAHINLGKLFG